MSDQHEEAVDAVVVEEVGNEVVPSGPGLAPAPPPSNGGLATLWSTDDPVEIVKKASAVATALKDVIDKQNLSIRLGGKKAHVEIEGWQTAGTLLGVYAMTTSTVRVHPMTSFVAKASRKEYAWADGKRRVVAETTFEYAVEGWSWEAVAEVRTMDGRLVGRGEGICSRDEENWFDSSESAVKGMAQTRAQSRALKQTLGFIVGMAGYASTPAEEVTANGGEPEPTFDNRLQEATGDQKASLSRALLWLLGDDTAAAKRVFEHAERVSGGKVLGIVADAMSVAIAARKVADEPAEAPKETPEQAKRRERKERADALEAQNAAELGDAPAPENVDVDPAADEAPDDLPPAD